MTDFFCAYNIYAGFGSKRAELAQCLVSDDAVENHLSFRHGNMDETSIGLRKAQLLFGSPDVKLSQDLTRGNPCPIWKPSPAPGHKKSN
ncbi:hypothetical protein SAMN05444163_8199 [Bradyrhizobium ottawaense]|uniref:Uncharacterized protein n=1 Tax=Bradyrhizobium ottawaense TaxID=931866 RepID=A0ABY0QHP4_9BRAD|nr:hypothetical protein SAMN05444163_8199 [Bradyrhizobium ottawaense]